MSVFRAYDIRGIVDKDFDEEWVERLGLAFGTWIIRQGVEDAVLGYDCRHSSPAYHEALARGMRDAGINIVSVGMVPTPVLYFAVKHLGRRAGAMITASHNPSAYNGFKLWVGESTIYGEALQEVRRLMEQGAQKSDRKGLYSQHDIVPAYLDAVCDRVCLERPLRIVVDGGNGAGGELCAQLLERLGADVVPIFCEPDGNFPNHHPDPVVEDNMRMLMARVREERADFGIGLDGDADRLGVVDKNGRLLNGDELLSIYANALLDRVPGATIIGDVKCSKRLFDEIVARGGTGVMAATGHSLIKARMKELHAPLAGEMSGHMFFEDGWYGFDDAIYGAARLADILARGADALEDLPKWPVAFASREINVPCPEEEKARVVALAREYFASRFDVNTLDGVRVQFPDGWGLIRASNTQPVLVTRFEAESPERLAEMRENMLHLLEGWIHAR